MTTFKTIARIANRIREIHEQTRDLIAEQQRLRDRLRSHIGLGSRDGVTAYDVRQTTVKRHIRRGYRAVRIGSATALEK